MRANVIYLFGTSHSGSTALGHFLNASSKSLFGGETYRITSDYARRTGLARGGCNICGRKCPFWKEIISAMPINVYNLYQIFFASDVGPAGIELLIDSSKHPLWLDISRFSEYQTYLGKADLFQDSISSTSINISPVISVKHPIRLLASNIYNKAGLIPDKYKSQSLEACGNYISQNRQTFFSAAETFLSIAFNHYRATLQSLDKLSIGLATPHRGPQFAITDSVRTVKTDSRSDLVKFFVSIGSLLGVDVSPERCKKFQLHSISGNRSVYWQHDEYKDVKISSGDYARYQYYSSIFKSAVSDWHIVDNKYSLLFDETLLDMILSGALYGDVAEMYGYNEPPWQ